MDDETDKPRLGRRMMVLRLAGVGVASSALAGCVVAPPGAVYAPGPVRTGLTDGDPNDPPGGGRGGYRARTGYTDADPSDGPGRGRGGYRRGVTDSDPRDAPGRGRGW